MYLFIQEGKIEWGVFIPLIIAMNVCIVGIVTGAVMLYFTWKDTKHATTPR